MTASYVAYVCVCAKGRMVFGEVAASSFFLM